MSSLNYVAPVFVVSDLPRSLAYYQDKLGFGVSFNYDGFYAGVVRDGCQVHLKHGAPAEQPAAQPNSAEHIHICFGVSDAQALASQFATAGVRFSVPLREQPYGKEFYVKDPDGYVLAFVQASSASNT
ncbi:MAG: VOC family protein [Terriglobia bacterium]